MAVLENKTNPYGYNNPPSPNAPPAAAGPKPLADGSKPGPYGQPPNMPFANGSKPGPYANPLNKPGMNYGPSDPRQQLRERGQERTPFYPNNGNPRGANNMPQRIPQGMGRQQPRNEEEANALREQNRMLRAQGLNPYEFQSPGAPGQQQQGNPYQGFMDFYNRQRPGGGDSTFDSYLQRFMDRQRQGGGGGYRDPFGQEMGPNPPGGGNGSSLSFEDWRDKYEGGPMMTTMQPGAAEAAERYQRQRYEEWQRGQGGGGSNPYMNNPNFYQFGGMGGNSNYYGGQSQGAGRYRPPTMEGGRWQDYGGYNYNLPNAFGSYPGYGQGNPYSQYYGSGYGGLFGGWG